MLGDKGQSRGWYAACWLLLLAVCAAAYLPGLNGPFVFDDFDSLGALGDYGGVVDWASFKAYVFGGSAGPTGRPLALVTFLADASNWPADVYPFKRTNLLIHLLTGLVLGVLIRRLLLALDYDHDKARWIALVAAGCWLLHPFLVSTTLYVVQRMAQLATLFVLAGLVGYLYGRTRLRERPPHAYAIMAASLTIGTILAVLCKENGALLPMLAGVIELTIFSSANAQKPDRRFSALFIAAPSILVFAFIAYRTVSYGDFFAIVPPRDFSVWERVLTQFRVLFDYLQNWYVPKLYTTGIFQDHFLKSTGWLAPVSTALTALLHIGIVVAMFVYRRRLPLLACAVLFFYAGHVMESTTIKLELYFEHRNYLPAALLLVPVIAFLRDKARTLVFASIAVALMTVLGGFTRYSATVWADYGTITEASAGKAPTSARAQAEFARMLFNADRYEEALGVMDRAIANIPGATPHLDVNRLTMLCRLSILDTAELNRVASEMADTVYDPRLLEIYSEFAASVAAGQCPNTSLAAVHAMFAGMLQQPYNADVTSIRYSQIHYLLGFVDTHIGNGDRALQEFQASLASVPSATAAMNMAALLATNGHNANALVLVDAARVYYREENSGVQGAQGFTEADMDRMESIIRAQMNPVPVDDTANPEP